jgi:hypothetical protein
MGLPPVVSVSVKNIYLFIIIYMLHLVYSALMINYLFVLGIITTYFQYDHQPINVPTAGAKENCKLEELFTKKILNATFYLSLFHIIISSAA